MKKLHLKFLFCMIGFSGFAFELTCEFKENQYLKLLDNDNRVTIKTKSDETSDSFRIAILEDKCVDYQKRGETELSLTKTDSTHTCWSRYSEVGNDFIR